MWTQSGHQLPRQRSVVLVVPGGVAVGVGNIAAQVEAETDGVSLVPGSDRLAEAVLVERPVLAGAHHGVRLAAPHQVSRHVFVCSKGCERHERSSDIPDVDGKVDAEGAAAEIITPVRPPSHPANLQFSPVLYILRNIREEDGTGPIVCMVCSRPWLLSPFLLTVSHT